MGETQSSLRNSPAGKKVIGSIFETMVETYVLMNPCQEIHLSTQHSHTFCHEDNETRIFLEAGSRFKVVGLFCTSNSKHGCRYNIFCELVGNPTITSVKKFKARQDNYEITEVKMDIEESNRRHNYFELLYARSFFEDHPHFAYEEARVGKFIPKEGVLRKVDI